jgi:hypothetical protein
VLRLLRARGCSHDAGNGQFIDHEGRTVRGNGKLLALVPNVSSDDWAKLRAEKPE